MILTAAFKKSGREPREIANSRELPRVLGSLATALA
jgi:hypothetical protein